MAKNYTKKGGHRSGKLWHDFQAEPLGQAGLLESKSAVPALVATIEDLPNNQAMYLIACAVGSWERNDKGQLELVAPKQWTPARRLQLADDLLWTIRFFKGQVWLQGEQLCVQPVKLAQHYAPVIRALKTELVMILREAEG